MDPPVAVLLFALGATVVNIFILRIGASMGKGTAPSWGRTIGAVILANWSVNWTAVVVALGIVLFGEMVVPDDVRSATQLFGIPATPDGTGLLSAIVLIAAAVASVLMIPGCGYIYSEMIAGMSFLKG